MRETYYDANVIPLNNIPKKTPFIIGLMTEWRNLFFTSGGADEYPLMEQVYILMKRLHQQYDQIMQMPSSVRRYIFKRELGVIKEENKETET